jgi:hypothetical protein
MVWDELARQADEENTKDRDRWIGVYIGVLAVLLAICSMGGGNAGQDATLKNIEASNTWAFFQAKNMRRHVLRVEVDALELQLKTDSALTENAKAAIAAKVADYKKQDEVLTKDPEKEEGKREGLDQLWEKGKALEAERDHAMQRGPYFDYGQAILQIAIVLASIALITHAFMLLAASGVLGVIGAALTFNGFTLFLHPLPFVG